MHEQRLSLHRLDRARFGPISRGAAGRVLVGILVLPQQSAHEKIVG